MITLGITTFNREDIAYNTIKDNLDRCGLDRSEYQIIWVDDASTDNVRDTIEQLNPEIKIFQRDNKGVCRTWNKIYRIFDTEWLVKVPVDCKLDNNWLKIIKEHIDNIDADVFVIPFYREDREEMWKDNVINISGIDIWDIKYVMGIFAINRNVFNKVGFLDEEYGWYGFDDSDFSCRCIKAGIKTYYIKGIYSYHLFCKDPEWYPEKKKLWIKRNSPIYHKNIELVKNNKRLYINNFKEVCLKEQK